MGKGGNSRIERLLSAVFLLIFNINWFISHVSALFYEAFVEPYTKGKQAARLHRKLRRCCNYKQWHKYATQLDQSDPAIMVWKRDSQSKYYDCHLVAQTLPAIEKAIESGRKEEIFEVLRVIMARNFAGKDNAELYTVAQEGTKLLVEELNDRILTCIKILGAKLGGSTSSVDLRDDYQKLLEIRDALGYSAMSFAGGGSLSWCHVGAIEAMMELEIMPSNISGSVGGAVVAAFLAINGSKQIGSKLMSAVNSSTYLGGYLDRLRSLLNRGAFIDGDRLKGLLREILGADTTFLDAYMKTGIILNISISSSLSMESPFVLNYVSAPDVLIWSAVLVSISVPGLVRGPSCSLLYGIDSDGKHHQYELRKASTWDEHFQIAKTPVSELFKVNQIILSQLNTPILLIRLILEAIWTFPLVAPAWNFFFSQLFHKYVPQRIRRVVGYFGQMWHGDLVLLHPASIFDLLCTFCEVPDEMRQSAILKGRHAVYKQASRLRSMLQAEAAIDLILQDLESRL